MKPQRNITVWHVLVSIFAGIFISFSLAQTFFDLNSRAFIDQIFLLLVPAGALFICFLYLLPLIERFLMGMSITGRISIFIWALIPALFSFLIVRNVFIPFLLFSSFLLLTIPAVPSVQALIEAGGIRRVTGAWVFATALSFLLLSFLDDFYTSFSEVILLTLLFPAALGAGGYFFMGRIRRVALERWFDAFIHAGLFVLLVGFILWLFQANQRMPLFPAEYFTLNPNSRGVFLFTSLLALPWQAWLHLRLKFSGFYNKLKQTKIYAYVSENLAGLSLALAFFVAYLLFAAILNEPRFDVDDVFFDADPFNYRIRLTTDNWQDYYWRSVHPFMILLFRPPIDLLALFLKGNRFWGALVFVALGGAACVYLAWMFIKSASGNSVYASLIATLLGFTTSHLIFGSLLESYIFLAASLILFFLLLLKDRPLPALISASLLTVGITHSNFAQNVIALFMVKPNIKQMIRFVATVLVFLVLLTLANNLFYPDAQPFFFVPSTLQAEGPNIFPLNQLRVQALMRAFLFHNVLAPTPILHTGEIPFIQFRFFKPEIDALSQYTLPIQTVTAWAWLGFLILGGLTFLWTLREQKHLRLYPALLMCMLFNVGLHLRYGKELFLYSPNWTYALILLMGLAWQGISQRRWFQAILLTFLFLLAFNNAQLLLTIVDVLALQVQ